MSGRQIISFLSHKLLCGLATTRPNGLPHLTTNAFAMYDGDFWLPIMPNAARLANLQRVPYACLLITEGQGPDYTMVSVEGEVELVAKAPPHIEEMHVVRQKSSLLWIEAWAYLHTAKIYSFAGMESEFAAATGFVRNLID
jgi:nitroimidazol reductase NimA-like FMN-containing flavoprotein (pyridoxamine 5'-phosphate oxidase superfamily)